MYKTLLFLLLFPLISLSQASYTINGYVRDKANGEEMTGVNIVIRELRTGTTTNAYGYYSLSLPRGEYTLEAQFIGYEAFSHKIHLQENMTLNIEIGESSTELQEVEVRGERIDQNVTSVEMSVARLDAKEIQKVPQLLGETDIIRTLTLLPGVTTVGEGSSGLNVRGGASDQNLILLDEGPVYNSSHLFGFFSIFNADAIKDVKLYKGGIPAQYGGRLSSVIDVRQKDGNKKNFAFNGGLGLLSSRLLVEGPIKKDKASYMIAGRRSYVDLFLRLSNDPEINQNILYFYDLNAKVNWRLSDKDHLYLSGYFGRDVFGIQDLFNFDWGNTTASLRWNHILNEKLFSNTSLVFSDYQYTIGTPEDDEVPFKLRSRIRNYHLKSAYNWYITPKHTLDFGFEGTVYEFDPAKVTGFQSLELQKEYGIEPNIYISHDAKFGQRWSLQYGLRYSSFYKVGKQKSVNYTDPSFPTPETAIDTSFYKSFELIEKYDGWQGLEPRLAANYLINENSSIKASFNRTRQYIHLISNTTSPTPIDLYRSAGRYIKPATVYQYAAGYFRNFADNMFEASVEIYYKDFFDLVDYRPGASLIFNQFIETELLTAVGRAYGAEFLIRKQSGRLSGWISYTLSRSERKVESKDALRTISNGKWYPSNYDKLHDFSLVLNYQIDEKWEVGGSFVFQTGRPFTPPNGKYEFEEVTVPIYQERNSFRIPDYHRLDLSATYSPERKEGKRFYSTWNLGIYNVYARRNPYSITVRSKANNPDATGTAASNFYETEAVRLSIFATAIPFLTWNFNF